MMRRSFFSLCAAASGVKSHEWAMEHSNKGVGRLHQVQWESGKGSYLYDTSGKKYLDLSCGIGVTNLGHCHPRLVEATTKQIGKLWHSQVAFGVHAALTKLMEDLIKVTPKGLDNFSFVTTGAEAVEAALKVAKQATGRQTTVVMQGSYHGRTHATLSMTTSKFSYHQGLRPLMPGITVVPIPYTSQMKVPIDHSVEKMTETCLHQIEDLLHQTTHPSEVCQIVMEPVLGEGGYLPLPRAFVQGVRALCDKHGILMTMDEVQSGFGRTGTMFSCDQYGITPDILIFAKGVACGMPLAGIATRKDISDKCIVGTQGGTYAGNCVAAASASEVLKIFDDEKIIDNVVARGKQFIDGLHEMIAKTGAPIEEVRGRGLMLALQFAHICPAGFALEVAQEALKRGMVIMNTSKFEVIRLIPPLNVTKEQVEEAIGILTESLEAVMERHPAVKGLKALPPQPCCATPCLDGAGDMPCRFITKFQ